MFLLLISELLCYNLKFTLDRVFCKANRFQSGGMNTFAVKELLSPHVAATNIQEICTFEPGCFIT